MSLFGSRPVSRAGSPPPGPQEKLKPPQQALEEFWDSIISKAPGKVSNIFPRSLYANILSPTKTAGASSAQNAAASYEEAAEACRLKVKRIVRECQRTNEKYTDPDFDIEEDFRRNRRNCLRGLETEEDTDDGPPVRVDAGDLSAALGALLASNVLGRAPNMNMDLVPLMQTLRAGGGGGGGRGTQPECVHRVDWIFEEPSFTVDGFASSDVQQGSNGDCWWVAAVATLCSMEGLMEKVCVARDKDCGVYGFVFYRDGEWISTVVDDALYLRYRDYDADFDDYDPTGEKERKWKERYQTGSEALFFAKCQSSNETWLPLLEKAYAKVHGDYDAIAGGNPGEAVEDMTGGVTTTFMTNKILYPQKLWKELLNEKKEFVFAVSSPWLGKDTESRQGLALSHAYSVLKAVEEVGEDDKKVQLVLIRNPWGKRAWNGMGEWSGAWSDGSKEWTPYWMKKLNHHFGDDGEFWMSFRDFCRKFNVINRTRLFDKNWIVVQQWTSVHVSWVIGYLKTKFVVEVKTEGPVVLVLRQLDGRYFRGLEGQYWFNLEFLLKEEGAEHDDYIVRARSNSPWGDRSISAEVDLKPGKYEVLPKITAARDTSKPVVEAVVKLAAENNPKKLRQIGMNYDIAHAKGGFEEEELQKKERERKKKEAAEKKKKEEKLKMEEAAKKAAEDMIKEEQKEALMDEIKEEMKEETAEGKEKNSKDGDTKEGAEEENFVDAKEDTKDETVDEKDEESKRTPKEEAKEEAKKKTKEEAKEKTKEKSKDEEKEDSKEDVKKDSKTHSKHASEDHTQTHKDEFETTKKHTPEEHKKPQPPGAEDVEEPEDADKKKEEEEKKEEDEKEEPVEKPKSEVEPADNPWNAVTVIGLLVYSKDHDAKVTLVKPVDPEDALVV